MSKRAIKLRSKRPGYTPGECWDACYKVGEQAARHFPTLCSLDDVARKFGIKTSRARWECKVALGKFVIRMRKALAIGQRGAL